MLLQRQKDLCRDLSQDPPTHKVISKEGTAQPKERVNVVPLHYLMRLTLNASPSPVNSISTAPIS